MNCLDKNRERRRVCMGARLARIAALEKTMVTDEDVETCRQIAHKVNNCRTVHGLLDEIEVAATRIEAT